MLYMLCGTYDGSAHSGIMNPLIMIMVAIAITLEKLLPRPDIIARIFGALIIIGGFVITLHWILV